MQWLVALVLTLAAFGQEPPPAFSHKVHAALKYPCAKCHAGKAEAAKFPVAADCQVCHPGRAVPAFPTARVYKLPDVVIFSHARHAAAKVACANCHGDVNRYDRLRVEMPTTMKACVECHKKGGATTACRACHELGQ
jgi:hypothetical protein